MGESQEDTEVLVMTEEGGGGERERDAMKDVVRQAKGQGDRQREWSGVENLHKQLEPKHQSMDFCLLFCVGCVKLIYK